LNSSEPFIIESAAGAKLIFYDLEFSRSNGKFELWAFSITLKCAEVEATTRVSLIPGYDRSLPEFFADFARNWAGWIGAKEWSATEGGLSFRATCDKLGHVLLSIVMDRRWGGANDWQLETSFIIEAGQLESIAKSLARLWSPPEQI